MFSVHTVQSAVPCACLFRAKKLQPTCTSSKVIMVTISLKVLKVGLHFLAMLSRKKSSERLSTGKTHN